ncbi:MAG: hypothetical protein LBG84_00965 [Treponema sp.]|jgi:hypothetical protein|nr:hypothetical protein [Treponema sp.]
METTKPKNQKNGLFSFLKGFASAFDITGQTLLEIPDFSTGFERDRKALQGDWRRVEGDIRKAMNQVAANG